MQPDGLVVPPSFAPDRPHRWRVDAWFHGRSDTLNEVDFLWGRLHDPGDFRPRDTIMLHLYGRYCTASKFAGEVHLFEALDHVRKNYTVDYALNFFELLIISYNGDQDPQRQSGDIMARNMSEYGMTLARIYGKGVGHENTPEAKEEFEDRIDAECCGAPESAYGTNSLQVPELPDYAVIDVTSPATPRGAGKFAAAGLFGEHWELLASDGKYPRGTPAMEAGIAVCQ